MILKRMPNEDNLETPFELAKLICNAMSGLSLHGVCFEKISKILPALMHTFPIPIEQAP